jgi:hypothetical protein
MKVYRCIARDKDAYDYCDDLVGIFSTKEKAQEAGIHYCKEYNKPEHYEDEDGTIHEYRGHDYVYYVFEEVIDQYYAEHLTPLAKALEENE